MQYTTFSDEQIKSLIEAININGYAVLPGWATSAELTQLQNLATEAVVAAGNSYVALTGHQAVAGSLLDEWGRSPYFVAAQAIRPGAVGNVRAQDRRGVDLTTGSIHRHCGRVRGLIYLGIQRHDVGTGGE